MKEYYEIIDEIYKRIDDMNYRGAVELTLNYMKEVKNKIRENNDESSIDNLMIVKDIIDDIYSEKDEKIDEIMIPDEIYGKYEKGNHKNKQNRRANIIIECLEKKASISEVDNYLQIEGLRKLYIRNNTEFVLYLCFVQNQNDNDYKIDLEEYKEIAQIIENEKIDKNSKKKNHSADKWGSKISINMLRDFLESNSLIETRGYYKTNSITLNMNRRMDNTHAFKQREEFLDYIRSSIKENNEFFTNQVFKARYYIIKYLYYFMVARTEEYICIIKEMSTCKPYQFINKIRLQEDNYTVRNYMADALSKMNFDDAQKARKNELILSASYYGLCLKGSTLKDCSDSLFNCELSTSLKKWKTVLFKDNYEGDKSQLRKRKEYLDLLNNTASKDLWDYGIDFRTLFRIAFDDSTDTLSDNRIDGKKIDKNYVPMRDYVKGNKDIERGTFIFIILILYGLTDKRYCKINTLDYLNEDRMNSMLANCGFQTLNNTNLVDIFFRLSCREEGFNELIKSIREIKEIVGENILMVLPYTNDIKKQNEYMAKKIK